METVFIWLDDLRPIKLSEYWNGYKKCLHAHSVKQAKEFIISEEKDGAERFFLDLDHDLGIYAKDGGDGIELIKWLIETGRNNSNYKVNIHSMNVVGKMNMKALINRYWEDKNDENEV